MLTIYTSKELAESLGYDVKSDIDLIFRLRSTNIKHQYKDKISNIILKHIEGMTSRTKDRINGKFGDVSLHDISTGGKGCLLAVNHKDFIIDAMQLGENCLKLLVTLANKINIEIVYKEPLYIFDNNEICIDGEKLYGYEASKAMEDAYYTRYGMEEEYE